MQAMEVMKSLGSTEKDQHVRLVAVCCSNQRNSRVNTGNYATVAISERIVSITGCQSERSHLSIAFSATLGLLQNSGSWKQ